MTEAERKIETSKSLGELLLNSGREIANLKQQSYDQCEIISHLEHRIKEKEAEIQKLKNDFLDALDLKQGNGPTALSMLSSELKSEKELNRELMDKLIEIDKWNKEYQGPNFPLLEFLINKAK